jgi:hypothetical protein
MNAVAQHGISIALACRAFQISETCYRYSRVFCTSATFKHTAGTTNAYIGSIASLN